MAHCILRFLQPSTEPDYDIFVPIVDGDEGLIPEQPETLALSRRKMPIMLGTTRDESALQLCMLGTHTCTFVISTCPSSATRRESGEHERRVGVVGGGRVGDEPDPNIHRLHQPSVGDGGRKARICVDQCGPVATADTE